MAECDKGCQIVENVWLAIMRFNEAGDVMPGHKHLFDHQTVFASGSFKVTADGVTKEFTAPKVMLIKAGVEHEITATKPGAVAFCVHPIRQGEEIAEPNFTGIQDDLIVR